MRRKALSGAGIDDSLPPSRRSRIGKRALHAVSCEHAAEPRVDPGIRRRLEAHGCRDRVHRREDEVGYGKTPRDVLSAAKLGFEHGRELREVRRANVDDRLVRSALPRHGLDEALEGDFADGGSEVRELPVAPAVNVRALA
jgi:hypothetical protein